MARKRQQTLVKGRDPRALRHGWILATKRPLKPSVHAALLSFHEMRGNFRTSDEMTGQMLSRIPRVRILLDRPWFCFGEGERIALVLWPPRRASLDVQRLAQGTVPPCQVRLARRLPDGACGLYR
jgi:hypothetical protein